MHDYSRVENINTGSDNNDFMYKKKRYAAAYPVKIYGVVVEDQPTSSTNIDLPAASPSMMIEVSLKNSVTGMEFPFTIKPTKKCAKLHRKPVLNSDKRSELRN